MTDPSTSKEITILSFCAACGALLPVGAGTDDEPICENCGESVELRSERIEGDFLKAEAVRLRNAQGV